MEAFSFARFKLGAVAISLLLSLSSLGSAVCAKQNSASFAVSVTVMAVARLEILEQLGMLKITPADVRRGYIDVADATMLAVRTNSPSGFTLNVQMLAGLFKTIRLRWDNRDEEVGAEGGSVTHRNSVPGTKTLRLSYRFVLGENLQPGDYAWPLMLSAAPL